ncbi:MAG: S26 family signal peptidase [Candidatus Azobacteroides pseudotrichonymphae]|nr:MAG: S26 family signal peptidase [Candidatus Azobacteroides pseudotrichonymphae]
MDRIGKQISAVSILQWTRFAIVTTLYILFTIWDNNYWLLIGLLLIFDIYILRIIPWGIWKRSNNNILRKIAEWIDAIVFALIAVYFVHVFIFQHYEIPTSSLEKTLLVGDYLFVSKIDYGPRIPNTPLAFPMTHNTLPIINTKSYSNYPHWNYKRLRGLGKVKRGDIVVFNFPAGDTVASNYPDYDYYNLVDQLGWERINKEKSTFGKIISRPVDRKENFVKRCIGMPGDSLQIINNIVQINGKALPTPKYAQFNYFIETKSGLLSEKQFRKLGVSKEDQFLCNKSINASFVFKFLDIKPDKNGDFNPVYRIPLTREALIFLKRSGWVKSIRVEPESFGGNTYPYKYDMGWTRDNFGPIWIPKKGATIVLNEKNLALYKRCIVNYEGNTLRQDNNQKIFINEKRTNTYTFNYDYYFMMGDNRHNSLDSRAWGFVPEDHIVGKPLLILMSIDKDRNWCGGKIRWNRIFRPIKD